MVIRFSYFSEDEAIEIVEELMWKGCSQQEAWAIVYEMECDMACGEEAVCA